MHVGLTTALSINSALSSCMRLLLSAYALDRLEVPIVLYIGHLHSNPDPCQQLTHQCEPGYSPMRITKSTLLHTLCGVEVLFATGH